MEIKQFVNAGVLHRSLVYDRHPSGAVIVLTMLNGDEVTLHAGVQEARDLESSINKWFWEIPENANKREEENV